MATATDIITYIGIPLAVLGVLPILYTFALSILTQRRIRNLLILHGHKPHTNGGSTREEGFMLRASPMTSLIEVEMPRYTIAPVERADERYWEVSAEAARLGTANDERGRLLGHMHVHHHVHGHGHAHAEGHGVERTESTLSMVEEGRVRGFLRGGSWRTFHWRRLVVGRKLYRIQYEDELREPPAEIEFADLVNFLMDWGADLDEMGWEKLRSGGLWTPAGTVLLKVCDEEESDTESKRSAVERPRDGDWVLRTSMPDDSDGILTLCVRWPPGRNYGEARNVTSLPPGWGRLLKPDMLDQDDLSDENRKEILLDTISTLTESNKHLIDSTSFRFKLESGLVSKVYVEHHGKETGHNLELFRISKFTSGLEWFTSAMSATLNLTKSNGSLWGFENPPEINSFIRRDSIPCGVLVILELLDPDSAPHWHSYPDSTDEAREMALMHHKRFQARQQAERLEATMPPEQARAHKMNREMEERRQQTEQMMQNLASKRMREQKRVQDAIVSPRMTCRAVADACLAWLVQMGYVHKESTIVKVAEAVLYLLILQSQMKGAQDNDGAGKRAAERDHEETAAMPVLKILEEWTAWSVAGGMKKEHIEMLHQHKKEFCYAACLVEVVHQAASVTTGKGKASVDMLECLRLWRKVRLG